ncbi:IS110 family transposase [Arthrobacter sp. UYEF3]|uniref:IS110 family transposase n=1 Tax=Arthrobacter sp. UYEF3 TaxID=1756365 RepID=UPI003398E789
MDIVHERSVGIDISKRDAKVCVRSPGNARGEYVSTVTTWGATTNQILDLKLFLEEQHVSTVVMEATSDYWKPFYYVLEATLPVMLVNARHAKNLPGRKTDVSDAAWLAQLAAHGLLRPSFVPPEPIRELRDLTRSRAIAVGDRTREIQRLEKFLESSGLKLSAIVSDLTGASSRAMLEALILGERDPQVLAQFAQRRMRPKIPQLVEALTGRFSDHHAFIVRLHLDQIDQHTKAIDALTERIGTVMAPFRPAREALTSIPGVSVLVADVIIAETGADMRVFPTAAHLASWAGVCPGSNESAGRVKSTKTMPGNKHLKAALGIAAMSAARSKDTYLSVKYKRIAARRGPIKAVVAIEHVILTATWHMLVNGEVYQDPGADYYLKRDPQQAKAKALRQLKSLGFDVTLTPAAA